MALESTLTNNEIANFLQVSEAFVSKWKNRYEQQGAEALLLGYNGKRSYLLATEKDEIISFLKQYYSIEELRDHIEEKYHVVYKSKQSYYEIMDAAGLSWKKTEKSNPKKDETLVLQKQEGIKNTLEDYHDAIESGEVVAFMMDECHLLWGDVCGYVWGRTNEKIQVPVKNEKERQTYYGAVDYSVPK
jgi:putative transposase